MEKEEGRLRGAVCDCVVATVGGAVRKSPGAGAGASVSVGFWERVLEVRTV